MISPVQPIFRLDNQLRNKPSGHIIKNKKKNVEHKNVNFNGLLQKEIEKSI